LKCNWCHEEILPGDAIMAIVGGNMHHECGFRGISGSTAHMLKQCSCYGGVGEDDPALTRRQAALSALKTWRELHPAELIPDFKESACIIVTE
jgi:hypothetical protein